MAQYTITLTDPTGVHSATETRKRIDATRDRAYRLVYDYLASWALLDTQAGWNAIKGLAIDTTATLPYGATLAIERTA